MKRCLAFVLGGGGARGAMQVGALRALLEAGLRPDLLVGTSIGAVNAAGLALWGLDGVGIDTLERTYQKVTDSHLMDPRLAQFAMTALSRRPNRRGSRRVEQFLIAEGITPELRFGHIPNVRLAMIGADLDTGQPVIYGQNPDESVLDGVMASIALPPWLAPVEKDGHCIVDGGAVSNLPIEPALALGATEIIALDLNDPSGLLGNGHASTWYLEKVLYATCERQACLEMALAAAQDVPVHHLVLRSSPAVPAWDFASHRRLFQVGYDIASRACSGWSEAAQSELAARCLTEQGQAALWS